MKLNIIDKIYIIHYKKLSERRKYIQNYLNNIENIIEWVDFFDRDSLTQEQLDKYLDTKNNLRKVEKAVSFSHMYIYEQIVNNKINNALILEDDTIFYDNFIDNFNKYIKYIPDDYDIINLNEYIPFKNKLKKIKKDKFFYKQDKVKAVSSYLISYKGATKLYNKRLKKVIDNQLNDYKDLKIFWLNPAICIQGSKNGNYKSSIKEKI